MALRGNGTLRADPRVSSSAEDVAHVFFSFFFYFSIINIAFPRFFRTCARIIKRTRRKRFEFDRQRDGKEGGRGRTRARRTAFAVVQKEQPNAFNAYYQSSIHKRADTLRGVSLKSNVESCKELLRSITSITRSATSERWAPGVSGKKGTGGECIPILRGCYYEGAKQSRARGG